MAKQCMTFCIAFEEEGRDLRPEIINELFSNMSSFENRKKDYAVTFWSRARIPDELEKAERKIEQLEAILEENDIIYEEHEDA